MMLLSACSEWCTWCGGHLMPTQTWAACDSPRDRPPFPTLDTMPFARQVKPAFAASPGVSEVSDPVINMAALNSFAWHPFTNIASQPADLLENVPTKKHFRFTFLLPTAVTSFAAATPYLHQAETVGSSRRQQQALPFSDVWGKPGLSQQPQVSAVISANPPSRRRFPPARVSPSSTYNYPPPLPRDFTQVQVS